MLEGFIRSHLIILDLVEKLSPSLKEATNNKFAINNSPSTGAEDFSYFSQEIPGLYFWLGVNAPGVMEAPGNHSPYFVVDDGRFR
jgi:amidohydrolase